MNQAPSHAAEPFEAMPFAKEIRASAKYSAELRAQADRLFELMREPLVSEAQTKARLEALQSLRLKSFSNLSPTGAVHKPVASSGGIRRLPSSSLI
jgi:hypothetical protein